MYTYVCMCVHVRMNTKLYYNINLIFDEKGQNAEHYRLKAILHLYIYLYKFLNIYARACLSVCVVCECKKLNCFISHSRTHKLIHTQAHTYTHMVYLYNVIIYI